MDCEYNIIQMWFQKNILTQYNWSNSTMLCLRWMDLLIKPSPIFVICTALGSYEYVQKKTISRSKLSWPQVILKSFRSHPQVIMCPNVKLMFPWMYWNCCTIWNPRKWIVGLHETSSWSKFEVLGLNIF